MFKFLKRNYSGNDNVSSVDLEKLRQEDADIAYGSIKLTEGLDSDDNLYRIDDLFAYDDEEYLEIARGEKSKVEGAYNTRFLNKN